MPSYNTLSDIVIFGAMGDLAQRKLIPALYQLVREGLIDNNCRILGIARQEIDKETFISDCTKSLHRFVKKTELDKESLEAFLSMLGYCKINFTEAENYKNLKSTLSTHNDRTRIFYYATPASMFGPISQHLSEAGCLNEQCRMVMEKPIGHDLISANKINDQVSEFFSESQIYRIDHYLGKETVQNLMALRFANPLFGTQWNQNHISHVEITVAEQVGIEGRWGYFDQAGQMRDMVQNHLLQLGNMRLSRAI